MIAAASRNSQSRSAPLTGTQTLDMAREVLRIEAEAVATLSERLDSTFAAAIDLLLACGGRVVVTGIGKSGHIARKVAATFASTGTPAFFVHPAEASHGDLGMIAADDVLVAFSNSGETAEVLAILPAVKRLGTRLIAVTGNTASSLGRLADACLDTSVAKEACPMNLAPTASTTSQLAMGDALAVALLHAKGIGPQDFARSHPGGSLGRKLLVRVRDIMRTGAAVPVVPVEATLADAVLEISRKQMGMTAVVDATSRVVGVFTDGDLRRTLERVADIRGARIADHMTRNPRSIAPEALATQAVHEMESARISQLLVVEHGVLAGALNMHDLFRARVV
ncbi:MAG: KpsF/GutQ family sugar-phosphate isomerase [Burkholderiales bacterium]|nr:KpsF/GutQ family sugar-phosphate isomerase [Burkholderiales bacterium]